MASTSISPGGCRLPPCTSLLPLQISRVSLHGVYLPVCHRLGHALRRRLFHAVVVGRAVPRLVPIGLVPIGRVVTS